MIDYAALPSQLTQTHTGDQLKLDFGVQLYIWDKSKKCIMLTCDVTEDIGGETRLLVSVLMTCDCSVPPPLLTGTTHLNEDTPPL